ncbi:MAG: hypothetical protein V4534_06415 [Myxococcota bacterium]
MRFKQISLLALILFCQLSIGANYPGVVVGSTLTGIGAVTAIVAGSVAGTASHEEYCDATSRFSQKTIVAERDCSYQSCQYYYCTQSGTTCYYDQYNNPQGCYYDSGYCTCTFWQTVHQTCPVIGCKDPNSADHAALLTRRDEPTYTHSLYALYAGLGVFGLGLSIMIPSLVCGGRSVSAQPAAVPNEPIGVVAN